MNPTCIRLGGPSDILAVLPYQLGFHPRDSLIVVSLHGTRMGLVQRSTCRRPSRPRQR